MAWEVVEEAATHPAEEEEAVGVAICKHQTVGRQRK